MRDQKIREQKQQHREQVKHMREMEKQKKTQLAQPTARTEMTKERKQKKTRKDKQDSEKPQHQKDVEAQERPKKVAVQKEMEVSRMFIRFKHKVVLMCHEQFHNRHK